MVLLLAQASDVDGDTLILNQLTVRAPENAALQIQPDGMYHLITSQDFNGLVELDYTVSDNALETQGTVSIDVIPVNYEPFAVGNASLTTNEDGAFTFDASDLVDLFDDIDTDELVISRVIVPDSEDGGDIAQNDDGTWTFYPTADFAGVSELQLIVSDGEFETSLDVPVYIRPVADGAVITTAHEGPLVFSENTTGYLNLDVSLVDNSEFLSLSNELMIDGIGQTEVTPSETLYFSDSDMLATISSEDNQDLSIESVSLLGGEGIIEQDGQGGYQFTPAEGYSGSAQIGFVASDGENSVQSHFNVGVEESQPESDRLVQSQDSSIEISELHIRQHLGFTDESDIIAVAYTGNSGALISTGENDWTFWPDDSFDGEINLAATIMTNGDEQNIQLNLNVESMGVIEQPVIVSESTTQDITEPADHFDVTVAPGDAVDLETPEVVSSSNGVDHIVVTGLPNDADVTGGLDNGDGSYTISGDLTQSLTVSFSDSFEGQVDVSYQGVDELDAPIQGANETIQIDINEQYALQSTQSGQTISTEQQQGTDWTQSDNTQVNVDFTDDTGSFDTDDNSGSGAQQDLDDNVM